jgi:hypothetical protein
MGSGKSPAAEFLAISEIFETEKYLMFRYYYQESAKWVLVDKATRQTTSFDAKELLKDDISGGINIEPKFVCNGIIYAWTDAMKFKAHITGDDFRKAEVLNPERKKELEALGSMIKEDDNHLLIAITPRN